SQGWRERSQLPDQIRYLRGNERVQGSVFFSSKSLMNNLGGIRDSLQYDFYRYKALPPAMLWLDSIRPHAPYDLTARTIQGSSITLHWKNGLRANDGDLAYGYVVYRFNEGEKIDLNNARNILQIVYNGKHTSYTDDAVRRNMRYTYIVTSIDRLK